MNRISQTILALVFISALPPSELRASTEGGQDALRSAAAAAIRAVPTTQPAPGVDAPNRVRALFFDASPWHGKPTRAFAWYGVPENLKAGEKAPGIILVHGGGGTAFANWVSIWTKRGYAALAIDTCGQLPRKSDKSSKAWDRDDLGGPSGWGGFEQVDDPPQDQWCYHATLDVILANSLLRSFPEVDVDRIGITGISWGGFLTCIAAGLDDRFKFAIPVYGCGFIGDDSAWLGEFQKMGRQRADQWLAAWDPSQYLKSAPMPMLWVDGTNDLNYPLEILQKSYRLPSGPRTLATRVRMKHGHPPGWEPEEIYSFADAIVNKGVPLPTITGQGREQDIAWATFQSSSKITKAELNFTSSGGPWKLRKWETADAELDAGNARVNGKIAIGVTAYYFNLYDERELMVSTEHVALP